MTFSRIAALVVVTTGLSASAAAQSGSLVVTLGGAVAADSSLRVHVAMSRLTPGTAVVLSDSTGSQRTVRLMQVPAGRYRVETRALGFVPDTSFVEIGTGNANLTVDLERVTALDAVEVAGTNRGHMAAFERRRSAGKGSFITRDEIISSRRNQVGELLRAVRGLRVDCAAGGSCRVLMVRSTTCEPRYFINGFPSDAEILHTPVLDVAGIEIYRGPSEAPPEYLGAKSMCGAVGIWTK